MNPLPSNILSDLASCFNAERLLNDPLATGEGVAIAVIDSGIERDTLINKHRAIGVELKPIEGVRYQAGSQTPEPYDGHQSAGHGTTVADIIVTLAPKVQLYSADVFGPQGMCEVETVIAAIRHAVEVWKVKVINLSLGISEQKLRQLPLRNQLLRAIESAYYHDVVIVAAAHNEHPLTRSYPSTFAPPLISVDKGLFETPLHFAYKLSESIEFQAHARGYLGPFAREPATSWATPHLTGIAARVLSLKPDLKPFELKTILYWMSDVPG